MDIGVPTKERSFRFRKVSQVAKGNVEGRLDSGAEGEESESDKEDERVREAADEVRWINKRVLKGGPCGAEGYYVASRDDVSALVQIVSARWDHRPWNMHQPPG